VEATCTEWYVAQENVHPTFYSSYFGTVKSKTVTANAVVGNLPGGKLGDGIGYPDVFPALPIGVRVSGVLNFPVANESDSF